MTAIQLNALNAQMWHGKARDAQRFRRNHVESPYHEKTPTGLWNHRDHRKCGCPFCLRTLQWQVIPFYFNITNKEVHKASLFAYFVSFLYSFSFWFCRLFVYLGAFLDGFLTRDGEYHYSFVQNDPAKHRCATRRRNPHVYRGRFINVKRKEDGTMYPTFNLPRYTESFSFQDFCRKAAEELLVVSGKM